MPTLLLSPLRQLVPQGTEVLRRWGRGKEAILIHGGTLSFYCSPAGQTGRLIATAADEARDAAQQAEAGARDTPSGSPAARLGIVQGQLALRFLGADPELNRVKPSSELRHVLTPLPSSRRLVAAAADKARDAA